MEQTTLFNEAAEKRHLQTPRAHARRTDPETSHEAADRVRHISELQLEILKVLKLHGPMHDEKLVDHITNKLNIAATDASIRSRRADLVKTHGLVRPTAKRVPTKAGRNSIVWEAV